MYSTVYAALPLIINIEMTLPPLFNACSVCRCSVTLLLTHTPIVRSCQIASNLIARQDSDSVDYSYKMYVVFFYLADFCFEFAIVS